MPGSFQIASTGPIAVFKITYATLYLRIHAIWRMLFRVKLSVTYESV